MLFPKRPPHWYHGPFYISHKGAECPRTMQMPPPGLVGPPRAGQQCRAVREQVRLALTVLLWAQVSELRGHWHHHRA